MTDYEIKAAIILEMLGRPKEHLDETMNKLVESVGKEKGVKITKRSVHEPKPVENKDKEGKVIETSPENQLYTSFAELEIELDNIHTIMMLTFKYMPSHIEIISPQDFSINNFELSGFMTDITTRLHHYDAIAKSALMNNQIIANKLKEIVEKTGYKEDKKEPKKKESKKD